MGSGYLGRFLGVLTGGRTEPVAPAVPEPDDGLSELIQNVIRERLAAGEATIIAQDPDTAERIAAEMGVTIPPEALASAREALEKARAARASRMADPYGYDEPWTPTPGFDREVFKTKAEESAAILQKFARYGDDYASELADGNRLEALARELAYGMPITGQWRQGPHPPADPRYPVPELSWLPDYLLHIAKDMQHNAEPRLRSR